MKRPQSSPLGRGGFTLIEIVVVLMVISIAAGIAVPRMSGWVAKSQVDEFVGSLTSDLSYTRSLAMRSGRSAALVVGETGYEIEVNRPGSATAVIVKRVPLSGFGGGLTLSATSGSLPRRIQFDSRGLTRLSDGGVIVKRGALTREVHVLSTGRVMRAN